MAASLAGDDGLAFSRKALHEVDERRWKTPSLNVTVKRVCPSCNQGWMSDLEGDAKPLLLPMIEGKPMGLSVREQTLAAFWATKTAAMLGLTHSERPLIPADDIAALFATREPLPNTHVWIAAYEGEWSGWYSGDIIGLGPKASPEGFGYCATLVLGRLIFQIFGHDLETPLPPVSASEADRVSTQIWPDPPRLVTWPPEITINDRYLEHFAGQFAAKDDGG